MLFAELGEVYQGAVLQTQDLTVINITKDAIVSRQAKVESQLPPIAGEQRTTFTPVPVPPRLVGRGADPARLSSHRGLDRLGAFVRVYSRVR